jgi:hypothetical protein
MFEGVVSVVIAEIVAKIVLRLKKRRGGQVKTERAFESKRFQQGRASRNGPKIIVREERRTEPA